MCTKPISLSRPATFAERLRGISTPSIVQLPCGKCPECMKKKQNSIRFRVYNEARKRGSMDFVTLTYSNSCLPISRSLWSVNRETGEMSLYGSSEIAQNVPFHVLHKIFNDRESESQHKMKSVLVKHCFSDFDSENDYFLSYSPCHDYSHVKNLLKRIRKWYHDVKGENADFSFLCVPEFGEHNTRRPHYHMCFFGAPELFVTMFVNSWYCGFYKPRPEFLRLHPELGLNKLSYCDVDFAREYGFEHFREYQTPLGYADLQHVKYCNDDGSDGFAKIASYVGKYVGKGVFEDSLVKDGFVVLPRISVSSHFGELPQWLVDWHLCRDIFGNYDDDLSGLSVNDVQKITEAVASRFYHSFQGYDYSIPIQFVKQIFRGRVALSRDSVPSFAQSTAYSYEDWPPSGKMVFSYLFYKVTDFIRDKHLQDLQKEFESFVAHRSAEDLLSAVLAFEQIKSDALKIRAKNSYTKQQKSLSTLMF